ncbi:MAG: DNA-3-methyladenine glycosylase 2 family protein [Burkholderiales bacterium]|nr:DNA-3-methyladenine glycosylase 2 family protein [Burkholderiales bacterium]
MKNSAKYFKYGEKETAYLKSKDAALSKAIDEIGYVRREIIPDMFMALIYSIIGQQISTKAHKTVWARFQTMFEPVTPEHISSIPAEELQTCGTSIKKALYIKEITSQILDGSLDLAQLQTMSDDDVCKRLSQIKGVGTWTAEMLMIFSMQRMDIMSWSDMAIIRGLRMLHRHRKITPELFAKYKKRYSPYATVASLYLWKISLGACDGLVDHAPKV